MAGIEIRGLSRVFRAGPRAVDGVDLDVADGELLDDPPRRERPGWRAATRAERCPGFSKLGTILAPDSAGEFGVRTTRIARCGEWNKRGDE